jgi:hypothetical protein
LAGSSHGVVLRYDGTAWRSVARTGLPGTEVLHGVYTVSTTDTWAVGDARGGGFTATDTLAAHWNGSAWIREPTPDGNPASINTLNGVTVAGSTVWAVGTYVDPNNAGNRRKLILQRSGGSWHASAAPSVGTYETLAAVAATGSTDVWAVGSATRDIQSSPLAPLVLRWNGAAWASTTIPAPVRTTLSGIDARTPSDVWVVGSTSDVYGAQQPYAAHFDGASWRQVTTPSLGGGGSLSDVVTSSSSSAFAVGRSNGAPLVLRWNGTSWTRETTPAVSSNPYLTAVAAGGPGAIWSIGYRFELNAYANRTLAMLGS